MNVINDSTHVALVLFTVETRNVFQHQRFKARRKSVRKEFANSAGDTLFPELTKTDGEEEREREEEEQLVE